jgi:hypothetical protein
LELQICGWYFARLDELDLWVDGKLLDETGRTMQHDARSTMSQINRLIHVIS